MGEKYGFPQQEEKHGLRMIKKGVLRIFGSKRQQITGDRKKKLHNGLHNLYPSSNIIRIIIPRRLR
jgi:hypothetical protein